MGLEELSFYSYAFLKIASSYFLTSKDYINMLSAPNVEQALKTIIDKALGLYVYTSLQETGRYGLLDIFKHIDLYEAGRVRTVYVKSDGKTRNIIDRLSSLADAINFYVVMREILNDRKPTPLLPLGYIPQAVGKDGLDPYLLPRSIRLLYMNSLNTRRLEPSSICSIVPSRNFVADLPIEARNVYGVVHDFFMLKLCIEHDVEPRYLTVMNRSSFKEACGQKGFEGLLNVLRTGNPVMNNMANLLEIIHRSHGVEYPLILSSLLLSANMTRSLIHGEEASAVKLFILSLGESILTRYVLVSIDSGFLIDLTKRLVEEWWPL